MKVLFHLYFLFIDLLYKGWPLVSWWCWTSMFYIFRNMSSFCKKSSGLLTEWRPQTWEPARWWMWVPSADSVDAAGQVPLHKCRAPLVFSLTSWSKWAGTLHWLHWNHLRSRKWGFEDKKETLHHINFSSLTEMMLRANLRLFPHPATRTSAACSGKVISILTWDHIYYFNPTSAPCQILKRHQEEACEGQDENPGEKIKEKLERRLKERQRDNNGDHQKVDGLEEMRKKKKTESKRDEEMNLLLHHSSMSTFLLIDLHRDLSHLLHQKSRSGSVDQNDNSRNEALQDW